MAGTLVWTASWEHDQAWSPPCEHGQEMSHFVRVEWGDDRLYTKVWCDNDVTGEVEKED